MRSTVAFLVACCAVVSPARAITIQEGDYYPSLVVLAEPEFTMTGGRIDNLVLGRYGQRVGDVHISGGSVGHLGENWIGHLTMEGGDCWCAFETSAFADRTYYFRGPYFRLHDGGLEENNYWAMQGFLADGSPWRGGLSVNDDSPARFVHLAFEITPGTPPEGDTDGDWDVDLVDLNTVRNHFGEEGFGLDRLNAVRNAFGFGGHMDPAFDPAEGYWQEITESTIVSRASAAVPEPPAWLLATLALPLFARCRPRRRWCRPSLAIARP